MHFDRCHKSKENNKSHCSAHFNGIVQVLFINLYKFIILRFNFANFCTTTKDATETVNVALLKSLSSQQLLQDNHLQSQK